MKSKASLTTLSSVILVWFVAHGYHNSQAQTAASSKATVEAHEGENIFVSTCLPCHSLVAGQSSFGPNLHAELRKKTATEVRKIVKTGKGKMPPFAEKLTDPDIDHLIAYLRTP